MSQKLPVAAFVLAGLAAVLLPPAARAGSQPLFPDLRPADFPRDADSVRFAWVDARPGALVAHTFHLRAGNLGFPAVVTAATSADPETRASRLEIVRLDDQCLAFAEQAGLAPEQGCLSLTATTLGEGVERLLFQGRYFDYQVRLTLVQSLTDASEWNLAPTGRRGEPQVLRLRTRDLGDALGVEWEVRYRDGEREVHLPLTATIPAAGIRESGLSDLHAALLTGLELFYDVADFLVWDVYYEEQIVDTGIPDAAGNDDECEVSTMCAAEYKSCLPTVGGWLGCSGLGGPGWGGGFEVDPGKDTPRLPNWRVGAPPPQFRGLLPGPGGHQLHYDLTSAVNGDTVAKYHPFFVESLAHVVHFFLVYAGGATPASWTCFDLRFVKMPAGTFVPNGSEQLYVGPAPGAPTCGLPPPGVYQLRYSLDPHHEWDESSEADNEDNMRAIFIVP
jgi:hypothetical protein